MLEELVEKITIFNLQDHSLPIIQFNESDLASVQSFLKATRVYLINTSNTIPIEYIRFMLNMSDTQELISEISWIFIILTSKNYEYDLIREGILGVLIKFTHNFDSEIVENGYWALSNLCSDHFFDFFPITNQIDLNITPSAKINQKIMWLLSNILKNNVDDIFFNISLGFCISLYSFTCLYSDVLCLLSNVLVNEKFIPKVFLTQIPKFLLDHPISQNYYYECLNSLTSGSTLDTQFLLENKILDIFSEHFFETSQSNQALILESIYNISQGPPNQVHFIISSEILLKIIHYPSTCQNSNLDLCVEIFASISASKCFHRDLVSLGIIPVLVTFFEQGINEVECINGLYEYINEDSYNLIPVSKIAKNLLKAPSSVRYKAECLLALL